MNAKGADERLTSTIQREIMRLLRVLEFALNRPAKGQMTPTRVSTLWGVIRSQHCPCK